MDEYPKKLLEERRKKVVAQIKQASHEHSERLHNRITGGRILYGCFWILIIAGAIIAILQYLNP